MKIVYLANSYIPSRQANSIHVMKMCQALALNGHEVVLVTFDAPDNEEKGVGDIFSYYGVKPVFEIRKLRLQKWLKGKNHIFALEAIRLAKLLRPDIVYTRCELPGLYLSYTRMPFILEAHKPFVGQSRMLKPFFKRIFKAKNLLRFITISKALEGMFVSQVEFNGCDLLVLHDAADESNENNLGFEDQAWPGKEGVMQVGYFGHLYKGRGIEQILAASAQLQDVDFHIVGGRQRDIDMWKAQIGMQDNLFFHGFVLPAHVEKYRHQCDVLLAPYQKEVWVADKGHESSKYMSPLKIFEYMAAGKCIICSDMPVLREVLNENNALLVKPDNTSAWIEALKKCKDEEVRGKIAKQAYLDFKTHYTWQNRARLALNGIV
ncbi:glycosyltransferase [Marinilabiliaceae bacterium JC017]|nr:glycosyltransferase [Marinilabiliaceae bacterium JC017]